MTNPTDVVAAHFKHSGAIALTDYLNKRLVPGSKVSLAVSDFMALGLLTPTLEAKLTKVSIELLSLEQITYPPNLGTVLAVLKKVQGWERDVHGVYLRTLSISAEFFNRSDYPNEVAAHMKGLIERAEVPPHLAILLHQQAEHYLDDITLADEPGAQYVKAAITALEPHSGKAKEADKEKAKGTLEGLIIFASYDGYHPAEGHLARSYNSQFGWPSRVLAECMEQSRSWVMNPERVNTNFMYFDTAYHLAVAVKHGPENVSLKSFEDALAQASALTPESSLSEEVRLKGLEQLAFQFGFFERAALQTTKAVPKYGITQEIQARTDEALHDVTKGWQRHHLSGSDPPEKSVTQLLYIASLVGYWHRVHGTTPLALQPESVQQLRTAVRHGYDLLPNLSILRRASAKESLDTLHMEFNTVR